MDLVENAGAMLASAISKVSDSQKKDDCEEKIEKSDDESVTKTTKETQQHLPKLPEVYENKRPSPLPAGFVAPPPPPPSAFSNQALISIDGNNLNKSINDVNKGDNKDYVPGGFWEVSWFQRVLVFTLLRLFTFVRKIFEDYDATKTYRTTNQIYSFLLALLSLTLPTIVYTIYLVGRYMQTVVFQNNSIEQHKLSSSLIKSQSQIKDKDRGQDQIENVATDDEGLVTARQSPINSGANNDDDDGEMIRMMPTPSPAPTLPINQNQIKPTPTTIVNINNSNKLKDDNGPALIPIEIDTNLIEDKQAMGIVLGALTHAVHGLMYIFWQIKRQVDLVAFLCERCCVWRKPRSQEQSRFNTLSRHSDGLEFFEDFYAGFLGVLVQVAIIIISISSKSDLKDTKLTASSQNAIANTLGDSSSAGSSGNSNSGGGESISISQAARTITSALGNVITNAKNDNEKDENQKTILLTSELIVSLLVIASLLAAVRRRDDGILTFSLSFLGWGSLFASRLIILSFTAVAFKFWILIPILLHIFCITYWIYRIAINSHNDKSSEQMAIWKQQDKNQDVKTTTINDDMIMHDIELGNTNDNENEDDDDPMNVQRPVYGDNITVENDIGKRNTDSWSCSQHITLIIQIIALFSIPSLFYWPIMFNLKLHYRLFKYLTLIIIENIVMIISIVFLATHLIVYDSSTSTETHRILIMWVIVFSIMGVAFLSCYVMCKPSLTEHFARYDRLANEAQSSGIYYEFCQRVFKLPDVVDDSQFTRLLNQVERDE